MCVLDVTQFNHMQSLEVKFSTLTGCQSYFCFISLSGLVTQIVTSEGDLWSPGVSPSWPYAGPGRSSTQKSSRPLTGQKGEHTMLAPHESSQAHREHIRTSGFYLPFLFCPAKSRLGRQVCQVPQLWPSDHITHSLSDPQRTSCCILLIHVVSFHILRSSLRRYVWERFLAGISQPQYNLKASSKKPSHVNAASQAREWLKLKGRLSSFNPEIGIPVLLEILSSTCRMEEKEAINCAWCRGTKVKWWQKWELFAGKLYYSHSHTEALQDITLILFDHKLRNNFLWTLAVSFKGLVHLNNHIFPDMLTVTWISSAQILRWGSKTAIS